LRFRLPLPKLESFIQTTLILFSFYKSALTSWHSQYLDLFFANTPTTAEYKLIKLSKVLYNNKDNKLYLLICCTPTNIHEQHTKKNKTFYLLVLSLNWEIYDFWAGMVQSASMLFELGFYHLDDIS
ncbi:hypothetical protein MKW94_010760, partial [Papaver nudicaule]|nr:hypothetical protein [Papaver nudicaule]